MPNNISELPVGMIVAYPGNLIQDDETSFLYCNGTAVKREAYPELYKVIGVTYGPGSDDGINTFSLPDLRGYFLRGVDDGADRDPGRNERRSHTGQDNAGDIVGSIQKDDIKSHSHLIQVNGNPGSPAPNPSALSALNTQNNTPPDSRTMGILETAAEGITGKESRPINVSVYWFIKAR